MAILQTGLAYPVLVSCPGGHCRGHSLYLLFWHHRHLLGGDRRIHPLGWSAAAAAGRPQRTVGLLPADTSRRVAADPHRWQDDHRHVRRCLAAALWANNVKLRLPRSRIRIAQAVAGGIIAGFGARLAMGCNLAAFFTGIPQFSLHAWLFAIATAIGSWFGARFTLLPLFRIPVKIQKVSTASPLTQKPQQARRRFRLGMVVFFAMIGWGLLTAADHPALGLAMLFGIAFGLLIERAQICFTSAFRDMWITGRTVMAKAIIFGMAASAIGIFSYVQLGMAPKIMWAGPNAAIGGLLFGFGIVLAGGCETGWMYRAVEGQVHYWWVGLGNVIGSTLLAWCWDDIAAPLATHWQKVNLLNAFGPFGGLLATYLLLLIALLLVIAWERHFFRRQAASGP